MGAQRDYRISYKMALGNLGYSQLALPWQVIAADGLPTLFFKVLKCHDFLFIAKQEDQ